MASAAKSLSAAATGRKAGPSPDAAIIAVALAGGILLYDLSQENLTDEQKLRAGIGFAVGAVILVGLAEFVPELGVPLSLLLLLVVAVGRSKALKGLAALTGGVSQQSSGTSGAAAAHAPAGSATTGAAVRSSNPASQTPGTR